MGAGVSRDDATKFLGEYVELGIYTEDPFVSIDEEGIGELMRIGVREGTRRQAEAQDRHLRRARRRSRFDHVLSTRLGLDYVSCSPYRVPVARLSAAQAVLGSEEERTK